MENETVTSGDPVEQNPVETTTEIEKKDTVAYSTYKKVLNEKKDRDAKYNDALERLQALEREKSEREEKTLLEQNRYKELWESERKAKEENENKYSQLTNQINNGKKLNAFDKFLGSRLKKDEYYDFVDTDKIIFNDSGEIEEDSVKLAVEHFRNNFGDDLLEVKQLGKLPNGHPSQDNLKPLSMDEQLKGAKTQREFDQILKKYNL